MSSFKVTGWVPRVYSRRPGKNMAVRMSGIQCRGQGTVLSLGGHGTDLSMVPVLGSGLESQVLKQTGPEARLNGLCGELFPECNGSLGGDSRARCKSFPSGGRRDRLNEEVTVCFCPRGLSQWPTLVETFSARYSGASDP